MKFIGPIKFSVHRFLPSKVNLIRREKITNKEMVCLSLQSIGEGKQTRTSV